MALSIGTANIPDPNQNSSCTSHPRLTVSIAKVDKLVDLKISSADVTACCLLLCHEDHNEFYWYRQDTGKRPEFLLYILGTGLTNKADPLNARLSAKLNEEKNRLDLEISSAASGLLITSSTYTM
uniref:Immunoglobulin V-set domain-containing protein n=1 Tax=Hucho hucho TaxID=62062 RepID=A0A4W5NTY0_9TELE